ncbi:MAG: holo-ACP synthase [Asticcacaulis sp.]
MIIGIGTDLCDIRRIAQSVERFGERFTNRVFTRSEQVYAQSVAKPEAVYAKRYAAKEAVMKALGTGLRGFRFPDIEIERDALGKPLVILRGGALERLQTLTPSGHQTHIHLSLTDEWPYAGAYVVIEALSAPQNADSQA